MINKALKIIPKKPRTVTQILTNTTKKAHLDRYKCAGAPGVIMKHIFQKI